jgi:hypothetical protein
MGGYANNRDDGQPSAEGHREKGACRCDAPILDLKALGVQLVDGLLKIVEVYKDLGSCSRLDGKCCDSNTFHPRSPC